eukprot:SAG11_NODE_1476_length_4837_cov_6.669571_3_plen_170_part_00
MNLLGVREKWEVFRELFLRAEDRAGAIVEVVDPVRGRGANARTVFAAKTVTSEGRRESLTASTDHLVDLPHEISLHCECTRTVTVEIKTPIRDKTDPDQVAIAGIVKVVHTKICWEKGTSGRLFPHKPVKQRTNARKSELTLLIEAVRGEDGGLSAFTAEMLRQEVWKI